MNKKIYYETTSLNQAVFLCSKGKQVVGINPKKKGVLEFTFINNDSLQELVSIYMWGDQDDERRLIYVQDYERARKDLVDKLKTITA